MSDAYEHVAEDERAILAELADHIMVGTERVGDTSVVSVALEDPSRPGTWLLHQATPEAALEIALVLTERAEDIKNGK